MPPPRPPPPVRLISSSEDGGRMVLLQHSVMEQEEDEDEQTLSEGFGARRINPPPRILMPGRSFNRSGASTPTMDGMLTPGRLGDGFRTPSPGYSTPERPLLSRRSSAWSIASSTRGPFRTPFDDSRPPSRDEYERPSSRISKTSTRLSRPPSRDFRFDSSRSGAQSRESPHPPTRAPSQLSLSRPPTRASETSDPLGIQTPIEKLEFWPEGDLLCQRTDKEDDDIHHDPALGEPDPEVGCTNVGTWKNRRAWRDMGGLILLILVFVGVVAAYPAITWVGNRFTRRPTMANKKDFLGTRPLMNNFRTTLVDPDTPEHVMWKTSGSGKKFKLVFSDEFSTEGRTFYPGEDTYWTGVDLHYEATKDLQYYDPDALTTKEGYLEIKFDKHRTHDLDYRSGMLQSWNQLCFKGGIIEASISLPGRGDVSGLWPGFWTMGNLGRAGYRATTDGLWPYSYHDDCDAGITANQSSTDGISFLPGMRLPGCACSNEDHPSPGTARSAPEIDALEATVSPIDKEGKIVVGAVSQSTQVAPFDIWYRPDYDQIAIYNHSVTSINEYTGNVYQEAVSGLSTLNNNWYDGKEYQTYGFEYEPGADGMIEWNIGEEKTWKITGKAFRPNGNIGQRPISREPMSIVVNCGMSPTFALVEHEKLAGLMPAYMRIDWIRVWQDPDCKDCSVTCDPPGFPTTEYIEEHRIAYDNSNLTEWSHTPYHWPLNDFVNQDCKA